MAAHVTQCCSAQERVTNCVSQRVTVGMTDWALFKRNPYAAQDELAACGKAVEVIAGSYAMMETCRRIRLFCRHGRYRR